MKYLQEEIIYIYKIQIRENDILLTKIIVHEENINKTYINKINTKYSNKN